MTNKIKFLWYKLFCAKGFGPKSISVIYNSGVSLESVFSMNESEFKNTFPDLGKGRLKKANFKALQELNEEMLYKEFQNLQNEEIDIIYPGHKLYSKRLLEFAPILFIKGQSSLLKSYGVAIVGSRNASSEGMKIAKLFASELAINGKNVISGYAKGIDTSAHLGALEKDGTTTIVLSFGIIEFSKKKLFENLRWRGNTLIVSQFHPTEKWNVRNAMIRNKLVCALSRAIIIVESGEEKDYKGTMSGTFHAGKIALEMKIPLFVISPTSFQKPPLGNIELIKKGGIEIQPKDGINTILKHLEINTIEGEKCVDSEKQMLLFSNTNTVPNNE